MITISVRERSPIVGLQKMMAPPCDGDQADVFCKDIVIPLEEYSCIHKVQVGGPFRSAQPKVPARPPEGVDPRVRS